ncbi:MAG: hypothetical protein IJQ11_03790 [Bacteroidales bacterium]|nr:hypothetical protein [Bacteroidales bacterium]
MFDHLRKYVKLLIPILLGLFFVNFVIDDYADEPRKTKGVIAECFAEMEADESECEEDDLVEEAAFSSYSLIPNGITCIVLGTMQLSLSKQSTEQFRGLVRRYMPRPLPTYITLIININGMNLIQVCAIFYFDKYEQIRRKTWDCGTMTCDYDHDSFGQGLKFQHTRGSGHGHGQWSWSNSPEDLRPLSERNNNTLIHILWTLQAF